MWSNTVALDMHASPEKIYAYLVDFARHAEWSSNVKEIKLVRGNTGEVGAEYESIEDIPRPMTTFARITDLRAPALIAWESTDKRVFRTNWRIEIEKQNDGSRVTQRVTFHPLNFLANIILYLFRVPRVESENRASLMKIKSLLESAG